jgi:hypothetical protein
MGVVKMAKEKNEDFDDDEDDDEPIDCFSSEDTDHEEPDED